MNAFLFFAGLLLWSLVEYLFHRFVLHRKTTRYVLHDRAHHQKPTHRPSEIPFLLTGIKLLITMMYFGWWFGIGFAVGILLYVTVHYLSHRSATPKSLLYHHQYHHLVNAGKCFGVTSPLWDYVFKTNYPRKKEFTPRQIDFYRGERNA